jgi:outer membrane receptor protein involved in Fe transport
MRLRVVVLALLVVMASTAAAAEQAASRFEGRLVQQSDGTAVSGASVSVVGEIGSTRTNEDGRFSWSPVPPTPFQLIVVLPGGQVARPVLIVKVDLPITDIPIAGIADEAITVLGAAPSVETAPASATTVLSARQIAQRSPETLMQALETVPGISQVSEGHAAVPAVRGMARGRTLFLIDGGRVTAERRVGPSATFLDPSSVEGIDVSRGPGSVAYGSDAIGGVISVRTRRAEPGTPLQVRANVSFGVGMPESRGSFELAKGLARGGILAQAHVRNAEDYDSPEGEVLNSGWEDRGFLVHVTHAVAKGFLSAAWQSDFGRDVERPRNNSNLVRFSYPHEDSHRFTANYDVPDVAGFRQVALTAFLGGYRQRTDQDRLATSTRGRSLERADISANDFHVKASAERLAGRARVEFGVDVNGRHGLEALDIIQEFNLADVVTRDTVNVSIDSARRVDTGAYVQAETALTGTVRASAGLRVDRVTTTNVGGFFGNRSTANSAPSGFGAITVGPVQGFSVSLQVARAFRDPTLSDRYFRGPTGRGFITGNPDLDPETSLQYDVAARYSRATTQLAVYAYQYDLRDLIERYQTEMDFFLFRNRGRARVRGFEFEATSQLGRGYSVELSAQIARGSAREDDVDLDDVSPDSVSILGRKEFGGSFYLQSRLAVYAKDERPGPSEVAMPGATLVDLGAGWKIRPQLELRGQVRNLLNDEYYASPDPRWVLAPGRSASVTAVVQF